MPLKKMKITKENVKENKILVLKEICVSKRMSWINNKPNRNTLNVKTWGKGHLNRYK